MGRNSKLSEDQWADLFRRVCEGESRRSLATEYGVAESSIRQKEIKVGKTAEVRQVAKMIVETNAAFESLPRTSQINAHNLAQRLISISQSVASAAELGAKTGYRLHALANSEVGKIDDADPLASVETLRSVGVLTKLGNDSLAPALSLLNANKEKLKDDHGDVFAKPSNEMTDDELAHIATTGSR